MKVPLWVFHPLVSKDFFRKCSSQLLKPKGDIYKCCAWTKSLKPKDIHFAMTYAKEKQQRQI